MATGSGHGSAASDAHPVGVDSVCDVAIIGGGIMGSALAYWLTRLDPSCSVCVIERDPTYARASSALSAASIRQQFTTPLNIRLSQAGFSFLRAAGELLAVDGDRPDIRLHEGGYLYLATEAAAESLATANAIQRAHGANVELLRPAALLDRFPWLNVADLSLGSFGVRGEGWFDGYALLTGFARRARHQGVRYVKDEVRGIETVAGRVTGLVLGARGRIGCGAAVNAAGPWARGVAALAGIELPVHARKRTVFVFSCAERLSGVPLLIDPTGFWMRPDGERYIGGLEPHVETDEAPLDADLGGFEEEFWPALAARIPAFEAARLERAWAGYYDMNDFDCNAVVGLHPSLANLYFVNGFSGHGMQHAAAVGEALALGILGRRDTAIDLSPLGFDRLLEGRPLLELNVIG